MKRITGFLVSLAVVGGCSNPAPDTPSPQASQEPFEVAVVVVEASPVVRSIVAVGSLEPIARVQVAAQQEGVVTEVTVREGDQVHRSEVVVVLDDRELQAELAEAEAVLAESEARLQRTLELLDKGMVSEQERDSVRASAQVARARAEALTTRLSFTRIEAPVDGVVIARHIEIGDLASPRSSLLELAAGPGMRLRVPVSELDVIHLRVGDPATVQVDALPDRQLEASIARIFPAADNASRQVTVELSVPRPPPEARYGFMARARLVLERWDDALLVPEAALLRGADLGAYVWVVESNVAHPRKVSPGEREHGLVRLADGVASGEAVVVEGMTRLYNGARVTIVPRRGSQQTGASP
jgi:membrane fusion protein (multidrug efflux system)